MGDPADEEFEPSAGSRSALRWAREMGATTLGEAFDLLVSDLAMPGRDGYALIRRVRSSASVALLPALAVTAHVRPEDRETARWAGFDDYIAKPLDRAALLHAAARLIARRQ